MIKQKQIVIGAWVLFKQTSALFDLKVACYIDEALDQKESVSHLWHPLKKPDEVKMEDKDLLFHYLPQNMVNPAKLNDMGFAEHRHYVSIIYCMSMTSRLLTG